MTHHRPTSQRAALALANADIGPVHVIPGGRWAYTYPADWGRPGHYEGLRCISDHQSRAGAVASRATLVALAALDLMHPDTSIPQIASDRAQMAPDRRAASILARLIRAASRQEDRT